MDTPMLDGIRKNAIQKLIITRKYIEKQEIRYLGNTNTGELHDLSKENANCQIDEILEAGHGVVFHTLLEARVAGFGNNGHYCLGASEE